MEVDGISDSVFTQLVKPNKTVHFEEPIVDIPVDIEVTDVRPKHKARRRSRNSSSGSKDDEQEENFKPIAPSKLRKLTEKDRHVSRTGKGRGKPKKGGAGGKGTWGKLTEVVDDDGHTHDTRDPNYDSEDEEDTYVVSPSIPQMNTDDFQQQAETMFKEYFDNDDKEEIATVLGTLNIKNIKPEIIRSLVAQAMEKKNHCCEQASQLISFLCGSLVNSREISTGFDILLKQLNDLSLDSPNAPEVLGNFIARAIVDDCLPPAYIQNHHTITDPKAIEALKRAKILLGIRHSHAKLESIWGLSGGLQPLMQLVEKIVLLLKEYLSSGDKDEALRCLQELAVPHFHHQVVYEATVLVLENGTDTCASAMTELLKYLGITTVITSDQFEQGFLRVFGDMSDIVLDVPHAYTTLNNFMEKSVKAGYVSPQVAEEIPQRGRKRFVSEGDGGALKQPEY